MKLTMLPPSPFPLHARRRLGDAGSRPPTRKQRQMMADIRMLQEQAQQTAEPPETLTATLTDAIKESTRA